MASCKEEEEVPAIGIDLGTTYSCVGVYLKEQGRVQIIPNGQGNRITPSCVAFTETERLVGEGALSQANLNATNTIFDAKRLIGRSLDEKEVQADMKHWPFKVEKEKENRAVFKVEHKGKHKTLSAEEISSMVLSHMRDMAEAYLQSPVKKAVITVPAYFNDSQRKATRDAAVISGLDVLGIINEPTAAAIAYGHDTKETTNNNYGTSSARRKMILVFDFGGGTFDVTILEIDGDVLQVRATAGDTHLGGEDIDNNLVEHVMKEFKKKKGIEVKDSKSLRKIKKACEEAKKALSFAEEATVNVEALAGGIDFRTKLTRFKFENLNESLFERLKGPLNKCLSEAGLEWYDIEEVIMVGGSTRIPKVQGLVKAMFPTKPVSSRLHPDEAVAQGAAVYAAMLTGAVEDFKFTDVTSLSLGVEEEGGRMGVVVHRNTPIPTVVKDTFTLSEDNRSSTTYSIYEGEGHMVSQNKLLGQFNLSGLTPSPALQPRIDVFFHIDAGGILKVSAKDQNSDAYADIVISDEKGVLSKKEVDRMIEDAQKYRAEDESRRQKEISKIQLEMWLNKIASTLKDPKQASLVSEAGRKQFANKLEEINEWLEEEGCDLEDCSDYDDKKKVLENLWYKEFECDHVSKD